MSKKKATKKKATKRPAQVATTTAPATPERVSKGHDQHEGGGRGANIQAKLPPNPHNPHDVQGVRDFLTAKQHRDDLPIVRRDPEIYEFAGGIDNQTYPIADAEGHVRRIIDPGDNRADEHLKDVQRQLFQIHDSPTNSALPRNPPMWEPAQLEGKPRYPEEDGE